MNFFKKLSKKENRQLADCLAQIGTKFESKEIAETYFLDLRDKDLLELKELELSFPNLLLDNTGESLKRLEKLYFDFFVDKRIPTNIKQEHFENLITQYTRQVFVTNKIASWIVFENEFSEGQYEIGLDYGNGEGTNQNFGYGLDKKDGSEKGQYLYQTFMAYT